MNLRFGMNKKRIDWLYEHQHEFEWRPSELMYPKKLFIQMQAAGLYSRATKMYDTRLDELIAWVRRYEAPKREAKP